MLPEFWWAPRKMPSSLWVPLPNLVAPCWTHNLPFIPCLPWSPCQDWPRTSTAPPTSRVSAKSEWLAELEFANYGASGMFWLFKLNSVWNKWKITTMHLSFKPEFPYDYSKWVPIGSHPFYSKHMPFNTLCSLSGSPLVSYWSPTRHFPFFFPFWFLKNYYLHRPCSKLCHRFVWKHEVAFAELFIAYGKNIDTIALV